MNAPALTPTSAATAAKRDTFGLETIVILVPLARQSFTRPV